MWEKKLILHIMKKLFFTTSLQLDGKFEFEIESYVKA
jgi:hypothetical protein